MNKRLILLLSLFLLMTVLLSSCYYDGPPHEDTPDPEPLNGVFSYADSTMTFNGDGKSIKVNASTQFAQLSCLPEGESDGTYVFIYQNGSYRRDKSEYFRIMIGNNTYQFRNDSGVTDEDTVAFYAINDDSKFRFELQK